jgi:hypothetical protein
MGQLVTSPLRPVTSFVNLCLFVGHHLAVCSGQHLVYQVFHEVSVPHAQVVVVLRQKGWAKRE